MTKRKTTGVLLAFTGVIILATEGKLSAGLRSFEPTGTLLMIGSAFCWAAYSILSKNTLKRHSAATSTSAAFCLGTLCLIPFSLAEASAKPLLSMSWLVWLSILYLAIPCSAIAYFLWNYLLEQVEVTKLAIWLYAIPIPTAIFSYIFLGERITESLVLGSFLVIVGIYLTES
jgi:drug/metabolite transporter (DMT)-like permease